MLHPVAYVQLPLFGVKGLKIQRKSTHKVYKKNVGTRYVLHTKDLEVDGDIIYLSLYMAMFL